MPMSIEKTVWVIKLRLSAKFRPSKGFRKKNCLMASFSADLFLNLLRHSVQEKTRIGKCKIRCHYCCSNYALKILTRIHCCVNFLNIFVRRTNDILMIPESQFCLSWAAISHPQKRSLKITRLKCHPILM
jgi:hypothetical protein